VCRDEARQDRQAQDANGPRPLGVGGPPPCGQANHPSVPRHPAVEIAIYPDVVWLAARSLRAYPTSHSPAPTPASGA